MLPPMKSGAGDDDVGHETGRLVGGSEMSPRGSTDHPEAGMTVKKVLDQAFERRGLHGDQDPVVLHPAHPAVTLEPPFRRHDATLSRGSPAIDWGFALVGGENASRG